jgi:hypothetical protein
VNKRGGYTNMWKSEKMKGLVESINMDVEVEIFIIDMGSRQV